MEARRGALAGLVALVVLLGSGCFLAPKLVGVQPIALDAAQGELNQSALVSDRLSDASREIIAYFDLGELLERDPRAALCELHSRALDEPRGSVVFALAELAFLVGKNDGDPGAYLAAAVYAQLYLLETGLGPPDPYDRRFRWAADVYNQGLLRAGLTEDGTFALAEGPHDLPVGRVDVALDASSLPLDPATMRLLPAAAFRVHGLKLRLRDSGLGAALIGVDTRPQQRAKVRARPSEVPVTAFLRVEGGLADLAHGVRATLELHDTYDASTVRVGEHTVPLETDRSVVLAHVLDAPELWRFSLTGLFQGDASEGELVFVQPYQRGRVPVVFVHGTASSPAYWADLFNTMWWEPELRAGAQFWFFRYSTGNPIAYSAAMLREALAEAVAELDPDGDDPALRDMVVVGHSQGGLLVRLLVTGADRTWYEELEPQVTGIDFDEEEMALLRRALDFRPSPYVKRAVFVCTPHRGSFLSERWYARFLAKLISFPRELVSIGTRLTAHASKLPPEIRARDFSSLSSMDPRSSFIQRLGRSSLAPDVAYHSIIAVGDADPHDPAAVAAADDGVVEYESAHLPEALTEDLVPASHSCQSHPTTIQALRRILLEHVRARR